LAAREVAVGALATVYAVSSEGNALAGLIAQQWSLPTALALLAWYVVAPQCLSTLATIKRETGGWAMPLGVASAYFGLAYAAAGLTYTVARAWL
jgi:ferrous iron transport protein B